MPNPPRSLDSRLLFDRPVYEWISRVNKKHQELEGLSLGEAERDKLRLWIEASCVTSLADREAPEISGTEVEAIVRGSTDRLVPSAVENRLAALRELERFVAAEGRTAALNADLIRRLHQPLDPAEFKSATRDPRIVAASIELACRWFNADSFLQLHPVEQSGIALLRLVEIRPFAERNDGTARIAASLFTIRSGLPPLIISKDRAGAYEQAVAEGLRVSTRPMVELIADVMENTLDEMIRFASRKKDSR